MRDNFSTIPVVLQGLPLCPTSTALHLCLCPLWELSCHTAVTAMTEVAAATPAVCPGVSQPHLSELSSGQTQTHTVLIRERETAHISVTEGSLGG